MKNLSLLILILIIPVCSLATNLPVSPQEYSGHKDKATTTTKQSSTPNKTKTPKTASSKRFIPTEKISADVAVSFPADI